MDRYRIAPARRPVCLSAAAAAAGRRSAGAEIGIFTAERYFSAPDVVVPALIHDNHDRDLSMSIPTAEAAASQSGRTAASSEASWNSKSGLLSTAASRTQKANSGGGGAAYGSGDQLAGCRGRASTKGGGSTGHRSSWTLFGRDCPCAGRKAVTVDLASEPRSPTAAHSHHARFSPQSAVEECLESDIFKVKAKRPSPPRAAAAAEERHANKAVKVTVTPGSRAFPVAAADNAPFAAFDAGIDRRAVRSSGGGFTFPAPALGAARAVVDEPPRVSLEVFQPIDEDAVMLVADPPPPAMPPLAGRRAGALLHRAPAAAVVDEEEAMSDTSSDLFDLESFAASSSYPTTYRRGRGSRRNSADDDDLPYASVSVPAAAEPALSECMYPASEASVVWSVATAEGGGAFDAASVANFSSAASACCVDDLRYAVPADSPEAGFTAAMSRTAGRKKSGRGGGGFLNSCRCEKAVSVGPTPVRVVRPPPAHPGAGAKKGGDGAARYHHGRAHVPVRT